MFRQLHLSRKNRNIVSVLSFGDLQVALKISHPKIFRLGVLRKPFHQRHAGLPSIKYIE
jgi:hypothetical protein